MNWKRLLIGTIVVYIVYEVLGYIVHDFILGSIYQSLENVWREDMLSLMWIMYVSEILFAFFFVYIFAKGYEGRGIMEGIRFGLIIGGFVTIPVSFGQYVLYNLPFFIIIYWIILGFIMMVINGIITALIYKPLESPAKQSE